jgi:hypothetical protein
MQDDIVYELKAVKNDCEIQGMKQAHVCFVEQIIDEKNYCPNLESKNFERKKFEKDISKDEISKK